MWGGEGGGREERKRFSLKAEIKLRLKGQQIKGWDRKGVSTSLALPPLLSWIYYKRSVSSNMQQGGL